MIANILIAVGFFSLGFLIGGAIGVSTDEKKKPKKKNGIYYIWIDECVYADKD